MSSNVGFIDFNTGFGHEPISGSVLEAFLEWERIGRLGFMDLPGDAGLLEDSLEMADAMRRISSSMVVAGIGGSSLGLQALLEAFDEGDSVTVADTPDSARIEGLVRNLPPHDTSLAVITKSGGTAETLAVFLLLHEWISGTPDHADRIVAVTDPVKGDLRRLASDRGWRTLPVPPSVGGRFSVMSPVGVFPAAYAGIDVGELLRGAGEVVEDFRSLGSESLAGRIASAFLHNFEERPVHPFFVYDDRLFGTALWFAQLWAESLGKRFGLDGSRLNTGQTPLACRGPADQHSLVQLFMEGPPDKTVTILTTPESDDSGRVPGGFEGYPSMAYLEGLRLDRLRTAEAEATGKALEERGLPVSYIHLNEFGPLAIGGLMMALEISTVLCGLAIGIDPLDQPGVERGKVLTYRALGRPGYEDR
ncbi:MAG: hypothetical protein AVO35_04395 [Candidatus Aegiribacteria sp. MLS_C]|nr:MAG: hypothetical protein AVO35_04395 [Candidatus Aegiribacteria sp. MLS_C]